MVEPEVAHATLEDILVLAEDLILEILGRVLGNCSSQLATLNRDVEPLKRIASPFPRLTYDEAVSILKSKDSDIEWGSDLGGGRRDPAGPAV